LNATVRRLSALAALLAPLAARSHPVGLSRSELTISGRTASGLLRGSSREFGLEAPADGRGAGATADEAACAATLGQVAIRVDGELCAFTPGSLAWEPPDGFVARGAWTCPSPIRRAEVTLGFLASLPRGHTHLARVEAGEAVEQHVARAGRETFAISAGEPPGRRALAFLRLGVEHILTGFDHLAFLLAVLLVAPSLGSVAKLVTSFTVAHSLTLAAAATGLVSLSPRIVEPLVAATVVAVALENLWLLRRGERPEARARGLRRRWALTFAFGLVHGLGFAGALGQVRLTGAPFALALASFNVGVELGQLAVAAVAVPVLFALRRGELAERLPRLGSALVGALGAIWLAERMAGG
jgi:hypothetical protein